MNGPPVFLQLGVEVGDQYLRHSVASTGHLDDPWYRDRLHTDLNILIAGLLAALKEHSDRATSDTAEH